MEYALTALGAGFTSALLTWHCCTSPRLNGDDWVSFRASSCGRGKPRPSLWAKLIAPVIALASKAQDQ